MGTCWRAPASCAVADVLNYRPLPLDTRATEHVAARADPRLGRLVELMEATMDAPLSLAALCSGCNVDPSTARRLFQRNLGQPPGVYYKSLRLGKARQLLAHSALPVSEIAGLVGYADAAAFARAIRHRYGTCPSGLRNAPSGS